MLWPPRGARAADAAGDLEEVPITDRERHHWAYLPVADVTPPPLDDPAWSHPIDAFIKQALDEKSVEPLPPAGKATLLRRLTFDLTGLPPTPAEIEAFLADDSPNAYEAVVDRLLASPAYGERYAQHWLDLARFAETDGFEHDLVRLHAWRYRDWVIDALNRDLPYDEFVRLQLAGDQLHPGDPQAAIATGFLLCGPDMPDINLQEERRHVVLNEMAATVGSVFLAMQFGCASVTITSTTRFASRISIACGHFSSRPRSFTTTRFPARQSSPSGRPPKRRRDPKYAEASARRNALEALGRQRFREKNPDVRPSLKQVLGELDALDREEYQRAVQLAKEAPPLPALPLGRVMHEGREQPCHVYLRGDFRRPGPVVSCAFPSVLSSVEELSADPLDEPRVALARWLSDGEHPLASRVIVNRLWQWHFGVGLVGTPSDFGTMGQLPTHPRLLDWLARRLGGRRLELQIDAPAHRHVATYRLASVPYDASWSEGQVAAARDVWQRSQSADPQNALWWHRPSMRLDGEAIRDAMLVACDKLSRRTGGPGIRPPLAPEVTETLLKNQWEVTGDDEDHRRRSIYLFVRRTCGIRCSTCLTDPTQMPAARCATNRPPPRNRSRSSIPSSACAVPAGWPGGYSPQHQ